MMIIIPATLIQDSCWLVFYMYMYLFNRTVFSPEPFGTAIPYAFTVSFNFDVGKNQLMWSQSLPKQFRPAKP